MNAPDLDIDRIDAAWTRYRRMLLVEKDFPILGTSSLWVNQKDDAYAEFLELMEEADG